MVVSTKMCIIASSCVFHSSKVVENMLQSVQALQSELMEVERNLPTDLSSFVGSLTFKLVMMHVFYNHLTCLTQLNVFIVLFTSTVLQDKECMCSVPKNLSVTFHYFLELYRGMHQPQIKYYAPFNSGTINIPRGFFFFFDEALFVSDVFAPVCILF